MKDSLVTRHYAEVRGAGASGAFIGVGLRIACLGRDWSTAALPRLVSSQRENSWQYLASSWAARLRAKACSEDVSGENSDGMKTSIEDGDYTTEFPISSRPLRMQSTIVTGQIIRRNKRVGQVQ